MDCLNSKCTGVAVELAQINRADHLAPGAGVGQPGEPGCDRGLDPRIEPKGSSAGLSSIPNFNDLLRFGGGLALGLGALGLFGGALGTGIFITYLVPQTLLFIPLADIIRNFQLGDTPWALILTYPTFLIPFCTWLLMGYFKAIPRELEECARIDGATRWKAMLYIIIPIAVPGILSAGIFAFTLSWNDFIYALVFLSSAEQKTVSVGVTSELVRGDVFYWGQLMAGALLGSIPVAFIYSFFVEHYVAGLTGSVKG